MSKIIISFLKSILVEALVIFSFIFLINNYIGNVEETIKADGIGYYEYLPSIFIHNDIARKDYTLANNPRIFRRTHMPEIYVDYEGGRVNKYPSGTALLQLPFFIKAYLTTDLSGNDYDGYQESFHKSIFHSTLFYLFLSIFFLKKILLRYDIKKHIIIFCQITLVLATSVTNYANFDAGYSHVYSLFAITAFIYFIKSYFLLYRVKYFLWACCFLGLIFILRQPNVLILFFIPFLADSFSNLKMGFKAIFRHKRSFLLGILLFFVVCSIQLILWYLQTGHFLVYSYQGEGFDFLNPEIYNILFSYRKGLFTYTPVLLFAIIGLIWLAFKRYYYLCLTWFAFFFLLTYVLSSWWIWFYACSYGLRTYIDFYAVFFVLIAIMLNQIKIVPRIIVMILAIPTIPLNIIQTYQYKEYILHWMDMDKEKYWKVFLQTNDQFKGLVWKSYIDLNHYSTIHEIYVGDVICAQHSNKLIFEMNPRDSLNLDQLSVIQILLDHNFPEDNSTKIGITIRDSCDFHYAHERSMLHFHEKNMNEWQTGLFYYVFKPLDKKNRNTISIEVISSDHPETIKNVKLRFLRKSNP